jgi:F-type H+-transporting ATPase subunit delta
VLIRATTQAIFKSQDVVQVNIPAESGEMGVLAQHVPSIEQLKPGLVEVIEDGGSSKQFFRTFALRYTEGVQV